MLSFQGRGLMNTILKKIPQKNVSSKGFSLIELMITISLSTVMFIGFMLLGNGVWDQLSFEDVHEQVETYGNYVLDDIGDAFRKSNIDRIPQVPVQNHQMIC